MRRLLLILLFLLFAVPVQARPSYRNWCQQGGQKVTLSGMTSATNVQKSFPTCTILVFISGTSTPANLYSDNNGTALGNPFSNQSSATGQYFFFADNGTYDIQVSASGLTTYTLFSVSILDSVRPTGLVVDCTASIFGTSSDIGSRINACIQSMPSSSGGVADASGFQGNQSASTTITIDRPVRLRLGFGVWTTSASPGISVVPTGANSDIGCVAAPSQTTGNSVNACVLASTNTTGDIIQTKATYTGVHDVTLRYTGAGARTAGAALNCKANGALRANNLKIEGGPWIGISLAEGQCSGTFRTIQMNNQNGGSGGAWYAHWVFGGCTAVNTPAALSCGQAMAGVNTDLFIDDVVLSTDAMMSSGASIIMDGGLDSVFISKLEDIKSGTCTSTDCGILWKFQQTVGGGFDPPRWITCIACELEGTANNPGSPTNPVIQIGAAKGVRFLGNTDISGGTQGISIVAGTGTGQYINDIEIADSSIVQPGAECIKVGPVNGGQIIGPNGISVGPLLIHDNHFSGCSQLTNNGYADISIGADVTDFIIHHNTFGWQDFGYSNHASYGISILTGGSDKFTIDHNDFNSTYLVSGAISDSSTGSVKIIGPNIFGASQTDMRIYGQYVTTKGYGPTTLPTATSMGIGCGGSGDPTVACSVAFSDGSGRKIVYGFPSGGVWTPNGFEIWDTGLLHGPSVFFSNLNLQGVSSNGTYGMYCSDCKNVPDDSASPATTCQGSGHGAFARRENNRWICN